VIVSSRASRAHLFLPLIIRSIIKNHAEEGDREEEDEEEDELQLEFTAERQKTAITTMLKSMMPKKEGIEGRVAAQFCLVVFFCCCCCRLFAFDIINSCRHRHGRRRQWRRRVKP